MPRRSRSKCRPRYGRGNELRAAWDTTEAATVAAATTTTAVAPVAVIPAAFGPAKMRNYLFLRQWAMLLKVGKKVLKLLTCSQLKRNIIKITPFG